MNRPALLVIDMQNDFLESWELERKQSLVQAINELAGMMRSLSHPVIWIRQEFEPDSRDAFLRMKAKSISITIKGTAAAKSYGEIRSALFAGPG